MKNKITVFYGTKFIQHKSKYYCNGSFGRFIDELSKKYDEVLLVVPVTRNDDDSEPSDYKIESSNIIVQGLPPFSSYLDAIKKSYKIKKAIKQYSKSWSSYVYIRHPNPFTKYVYNVCKNRNLQVYLHLVGDTKSVVSEGSKYNGIMKKIAIKHIDRTDNDIKKIVSVTPTLVNGTGLKRFYNSEAENVKEIRTSTFSLNEVITEVPEKNKFRLKLLYVGYLRHEKGLLYLLEAYNKLLNLVDVQLTIVGNGDVLSLLKKKAEELNIDDKVTFMGHIPIGERLFSIYREHDIFILPSISEGTPRVLLEAMCNGLAIIATNVGGIPYTITNRYNGLLVNSKSSDELVDAVLEIEKDDELRKLLVANGIEFAKKNSIEAHVGEVYGFFHKFS